MNNTEFISFLDTEIQNEMILGAARNENRLTGLRNIKSDFNYISSKDSNLSTIDILKRMFKEREENENIYQNVGKLDLCLQERIEADIISKWLPKEPLKSDIIDYLNTLIDIPKQKSSFKKFQEACIFKFGQKVDSNVILEFINGN